MSVKTYDPACYDLAEHFLRGEPCAKDPALFAKHCHSLALAMQETIEDWFYEEPPVAVPRIANSFDHVIELIDRAMQEA